MGGERGASATSNNRRLALVLPRTPNKSYGFVLKDILSQNTTIYTHDDFARTSASESSRWRPTRTYNRIKR